MNHSFNETLLHPLAVGVLVALCVAVVLVPRRFGVVPFLLMACFISQAQRAVIFTLDFSLMRILVIAALARIWWRRDYRDLRGTAMDLLMVLWVVSMVTIYVTRNGTLTAFINRLGWSMDALGMYFVFRCFIRSWEDVRTIVVSVAAVSLPIAAAFAFEYVTRWNLFSAFGGVRAETWVRQGRLRCQGAFSHPIIAGCFWAAFLPLVFAMWWRDQRMRMLTFLSIPAILLTIAATASSTPAASVLVAGAGAALFPLRRYLSWVRWGLLAGFIGLCLTMKAKPWHLISRIDLSGGSTGRHRYRLIDEAINHFDEWYVLGTPSTVHWGPGLFDVTCQYVAQGVNGGLSTLLLFFAIIAVAFAYVGVAMRSAEAANDTERLTLAYGLGVTMIVHATNFIGISYFGQTLFLWFLTLAVISSVRSFELPERASDVRGVDLPMLSVTGRLHAAR